MAIAINVASGKSTRARAVILARAWDIPNLLGFSTIETAKRSSDARGSEVSQGVLTSDVSDAYPPVSGKGGRVLTI